MRILAAALRRQFPLAAVVVDEMGQDASALDPPLYRISPSLNLTVAASRPAAFCTATIIFTAVSDIVLHAAPRRAAR